MTPTLDGVTATFENTPISAPTIRLKTRVCILVCHMDTSIRISKEVKDHLRRLQETWRRAKGEAPTQQELVSKGLGFLSRHWDEFLAEAAWRPFTKEEWKQIEKLQFPGGGWSSDEIDEVVYGERG